MPYKDPEKRKECQKRYYHRVMSNPESAKKEKERHRVYNDAKTRHDMKSKKKAIEEGKARYFTGLPCKNGHISERFVSNSGCIECNNERSAKNRENPYYKEYYKNWSKEWREASPEKHNAKEARRRAAKLNATPEWANQGYINIFYDHARMESERTGKEVHVDHIVPLQGKTVCGLHCEDNLQLLFAVDNCQKHNTWSTL